MSQNALHYQFCGVHLRLNFKDLWDNLQVTLVTSMLQVEVGECCANNRAEIIEIVVPISKG